MQAKLKLLKETSLLGGGCCDPQLPEEGVLSIVVTPSSNPIYTMFQQEEDDYLRRVYFSMVVTASSIPSAACFTRGRTMWSLVT